ncbi:MAG: hypothetical protein ABIP79_05885 [Chitinophagaceae bacterium]
MSKILLLGRCSTKTTPHGWCAEPAYWQTGLSKYLHQPHELKTSRPNLQYTVLENSVHSIAKEHPDVIIKAITDMIELIK